MAPLHGASFAWPQPQVVTALDSPAASVLQSPGERWSTFLDRMVIDHAVVSAGVAPRVRSALIYAFDQDPALDEAPPSAGHWLHRRRVRVVRLKAHELRGGPKPVSHLRSPAAARHSG